MTTTRETDQEYITTIKNGLVEMIISESKTGEITRMQLVDLVDDKEEHFLFLKEENTPAVSLRNVVSKKENN